MPPAFPMFWMLGSVTALSVLVVLVLLGRRNERAVRRDREPLLPPKGERVYKDIEGRMQSNIDLAELAYDEAFTVRELGSMEEARHLLDVGFRVIEHFSPSMLRLLAAMA